MQDVEFDRTSGKTNEVHKKSVGIEGESNLLYILYNSNFVFLCQKQIFIYNFKIQLQFFQGCVMM